MVDWRSLVGCTGRWGRGIDIATVRVQVRHVSDALTLASFDGKVKSILCNDT
jgi:hypothetical protein